jgi:hypothetical protein
MCSTSVRKSGRKVRQRAQLVGHHAHPDVDVADQLAFRRVGKAPFVIQLVDLADIVEHHARQQQVEVRAGSARR